jgi:hypothetical protein
MTFACGGGAGGGGGGGAGGLAGVSPPGIVGVDAAHAIVAAMNSSAREIRRMRIGSQLERVAGLRRSFVDLSGRRGGHFHGNGARPGLREALDDGKGERRDSGYNPSPWAIVNP